MPQTLTITFPAFELQLHDGDKVTVPLSDIDALHLKKSVAELAKKYQEEFQKKRLNLGKYQNILNEIQEGVFEQRSVSVDFPASKDGITHPSIRFSFDYFLKKIEGALWAIIPALAIEATGVDEDELENHLKEAMKVDFSSKKRLRYLQSVFNAIWFKEVSLQTAKTDLTFYTPSELADVRKEEQKKLLPQVAKKLSFTGPITYGRDRELAQMERILDSNFSKNILVVGASGTGKTALVQELAFRRQQQKADDRIWETTASILVKELTMNTGWQDNLSLLVKELIANNDILFIRNIAELFEVGQYEGNAVSMAEYLRPYISRGELTMITECTPEQRAWIDVRSPNYLSFFQTIQLTEPKQGLEDIIEKKVMDIAGARKVVFQKDAILEVIRLHKRFSPYSGMPGKPIRFLESILLSVAPELPQKKKISTKKKQKKSNVSVKPVLVSRHSILQHYCDESGMPLFMVDPELPMDVEEIKSGFNQQVYGQPHAIHAVVDLMAAVKTALTRTGKPIASFLFVGPTGVGKTELAKVLAEFMFSSRDRLIRFDMSEFGDPFSIARLTGHGFSSDGLLTSAVRREPFCVLLFDEIEKADPTFYDLLLQILGEGRLTDSKGGLVNFCSAIIIMTSNIGASKLQGGRIGWKKDIDTQEVTDHFVREVEKNFKPELFNRIDSVVAFEPLSKATVRKVVEREISLLKKREGIHFRKLDLQIDPPVLDHLANIGYDPKYGARYLQRTIREKIIIPLSYSLNQHDFDDQLIIALNLENGELNIQTSSNPMAFELLMEQWDRLTLADQFSNLRRKMMMMLEGPIFMRMQSEVDMMEGELQQDEEAFWKDFNKGDLYTELVNAKEKTDQLYETIKSKEIETALEAMEQNETGTDFKWQLEKYEAEYFDLLLEIYGHLHPKAAYCQLGIYGSDLLEPAHFYLRLIEMTGYETRYIQAVWYRERFMGVDNDNPYVHDDQKKESPYVKRQVTKEELANGHFSPSEPTDRLYGIEFYILGNGASIFFSPENGVQEWETPNNKEGAIFHIKTGEWESPTPENIHRRSFYQLPKPRRFVRLHETVDTILNLQVQTKQKELPEILHTVLEDVFKEEVERYFY